jgi:hypothetical protein
MKLLRFAIATGNHSLAAHALVFAFLKVKSDSCTKHETEKKLSNGK